MSTTHHQPAAQVAQHLTIRDITSVARMSRSHLYNLVARGEFPQPVTRLPRYTRWTAEDVNAWLADPAAWIAAHRDKVGASA